MSPKARWVTAIVGLLGANVLAMVTLATVANVGHSEVIPSYYDKAVHYDDVMVQAQINRALGWRIETTLVGGVLDVVVRDPGGLPLDGAAIRTTGYPRADAGTRFDVALTAQGAGRYRATADRRLGVHDLAVTIDRAGQRFIAHVMVEGR